MNIKLMKNEEKMEKERVCICMYSSSSSSSSSSSEQYTPHEIYLFLVT